MFRIFHKQITFSELIGYLTFNSNFKKIIKYYLTNILKTKTKHWETKNVI